MRTKLFKHQRKRSAGKLVTGILLGGMVGATVGWLTAPGAGEEFRRRLTGDIKSARDRIKTSEGNAESQARELVEDVSSTSVGF